VPTGEPPSSSPDSERSTVDAPFAGFASDDPSPEAAGSLPGIVVAPATSAATVVETPVGGSLGVVLTAPPTVDGVEGDGACETGPGAAVAPGAAPPGAALADGAAVTPGGAAVVGDAVAGGALGAPAERLQSLPANAPAP
jgi:hypothetical protein